MDYMKADEKDPKLYYYVAWLFNLSSKYLKLANKDLFFWVFGF
jgi:hypothetical protein